MPRLLRKIRLSRWVPRETWPQWVPNGDVPADALADLPTTKNTLSVWVLDEVPDIPRLVAAIAATRDTLVPFDYIQFDSSIVESIGVEISSSEGGTQDLDLNQKAHRDLTDISGQKLVKLALTISDHCQPVRVSWKQVAIHMEDAIRMGRIRRDKLAERVVKKMQKISPGA